MPKSVVDEPIGQEIERLCDEGENLEPEINNMVFEERKSEALIVVPRELEPYTSSDAS